MFINEIIDCTNGILVNGENKYIDSFSIDSRSLNINDLFIAIKGDKFDANNFIGDVLEKGAIGVIYQGVIDNSLISNFNDKIFIKVDDTIKALQDMARYKRSLYDIPVVAITGSVGKTSSKDIIASIMGRKYNVLSTEGNLNNHIGLPLTILKLKNHNAMCIEVGMNHFGEIKLLADILKPTVSIITNIGTAHIGNLGSRNNILKAKLEILEGMKDKNIIINNDNDILHEWYLGSKNDYNIITYGIDNISDYKALNVNLDVKNSCLDINIDNSIYDIKINVPGIHFVYNALCGVALGCYLNIDIKDIIYGIFNFKLSLKRMEERKLDNNITLLVDCYNANYDSVKAAIEVLGKYKSRKIAVLGSMLELGEYSKELHQKIGDLLSIHNIDILIVTGDEAKYIYNNSMVKEKYICKDNFEVINLINKIKRENDIILFKASNSMNFIEIVENIC